jgi:putative phosphoribosyl transferase
MDAMRDSFTDRREAGRLLGRAVQHLGIGPGALVLGLPRGGLPVAHEVAAILGAPLDVMLVRKVGVPGQPELAAGAVADGSHPTTVFNHRVLDELGLSEVDLQGVIADALSELHRRDATYRGGGGGRPAIPVAGRTVIVVDDGLATGSTARAAAMVLRARGASRLVLAVPVAPADSIEEMRDAYDEVVCVLRPRPFWSVGCHYDDFTQVRDDEVVALLEAASGDARACGPDEPWRPAP